MKNATKHPYPSQDSNPGPRDLKPNALALSHRAGCSNDRHLKMEKEKNIVNSAYYLNEKEEKQWAQVSRQGADHDDFNFFFFNKHHIN